MRSTVIASAPALARRSRGLKAGSSQATQKIPVNEQVEVLSLLGDVAVGDQGPTLHLHSVLGKPDGSVVCGHLIEGICPADPGSDLDSAAELSAQAQRSETGLALIDIA